MQRDEWKRLTLSELRKQLQSKGLSSEGQQSELGARLEFMEAFGKRKGRKAGTARAELSAAVAAAQRAAAEVLESAPDSTSAVAAAAERKAAELLRVDAVFAVWQQLPSVARRKAGTALQRLAAASRFVSSLLPAVAQSTEPRLPTRSEQRADTALLPLLRQLQQQQQPLSSSHETTLAKLRALCVRLEDQHQLALTAFKEACRKCENVEAVKKIIPHLDDMTHEQQVVALRDFVDSLRSRHTLESIVLSQICHGEVEDVSSYEKALDQMLTVLSKAAGEVRRGCYQAQQGWDLRAWNSLLAADEQRGKDANDGSCEIDEEYCAFSELMVDNTSSGLSIVEFGIVLNKLWRIDGVKLVGVDRDSVSSDRLLELEEVLARFTRITLKFSKIGDIDCLSNGNSWTSSSLYRTTYTSVRCTHRVIFHEGPPFLRLALFVPFNCSLVPAPDSDSLVQESSRSHVIRESGELLREFLVSDKKVRESLLRHASATLRGLCMGVEDLAKHYYSVLRFSRYDARIVLEAKQIIIKMLTGLDIESATQRPNWHLAGDSAPRVALCTWEHVQRIEAILRSSTGHPMKHVKMAQSNFQSVLKRVREMTASHGMSFVSVQVTGALAPLDFRSLLRCVEQKNSSVCLLVVLFEGCVDALRDIGRVAVPGSLRSYSFVNERKYTLSSVVGRAVLWSDSSAARNCGMSKFEVSYLLDGQREHSRWKDELYAWAAEDDTEFSYCILVSCETELIKSQFSSGWVVADCAAPLWEPGSSLARRVVLINAHFMSADHFRFVTSTVFERSGKVILVMAHLDPAFLSAARPDDSSRIFRAKVFRMPSLASSVDCEAFGVREASQRMHWALKMILGPLWTLQMSRRLFLEGENDFCVDALAASCSPPLSQLVVKDALLFVHSVLVRQLHNAHSWLHVILNPVCNVVARADFDPAKTVTFHDFVFLSASAQWASQFRRIFMWLQHFCSCSDDIPFVSFRNAVIEAGREKGNVFVRNSSSVHLLAVFAAAGRECLEPFYAYVPHSDGLLSQSALQGTELDWETAITSISASVFMHACATLPGPLRLASLLGPHQLNRVLGSAVGGDFDDSVKRLWFQVEAHYALEEQDGTDAPRSFCEEVRHHLNPDIPRLISVARWHVSACASGPDVQTLVGDLRLPLRLGQRSGSSDDTVVNRLLQLDEPRDALLGDLRDFFLKLPSERFSNRIPVHLRSADKSRRALDNNSTLGNGTGGNSHNNNGDGSNKMNNNTNNNNNNNNNNNSNHVNDTENSGNSSNSGDDRGKDSYLVSKDPRGYLLFGRAFAELLFDVHFESAAAYLGSMLCMEEDFVHLRRWLKDPSRFVFQDEKSLANRVAARFSVTALSLFVERCASCSSFLAHLVKELNFLDRISLLQVAFSAGAAKHTILFLLAECCLPHADLKGIEKSKDPEFDALLSRLVRFAERDLNGLYGVGDIPFHESPVLQRLYFEAKFEGDVKELARIHRSWFSHPTAAWECLLRQCSKDQRDRYIFLWALFPVQPLRRMPVDTHDCQELVAKLDAIGFEENLSACLQEATPFALYLKAPHYLDSATFQCLNAMYRIHSVRTAETLHVLNIDDFGEFHLQLDVVPFPRIQVEEIKRDTLEVIRNAQVLFIEDPASVSLEIAKRDFFWRTSTPDRIPFGALPRVCVPRVSEGVSLDTIIANASILRCLCEWNERKGSQLLEGFDEMDLQTNIALVSFVIETWFACFGLSDIFQELQIRRFESLNFAAGIQKMTGALPPRRLVCNCVQTSSSVFELFGRFEDDAVFTLRCLAPVFELVTEAQRPVWFLEQNAKNLLQQNAAAVSSCALVFNSVVAKDPSHIRCVTLALRAVRSVEVFHSLIAPLVSPKQHSSVIEDLTAVAADLGPGFVSRLFDCFKQHSASGSWLTRSVFSMVKNFEVSGTNSLLFKRDLIGSLATVRSLPNASVYAILTERSVYRSLSLKKTWSTRTASKEGVIAVEDQRFAAASPLFFSVVRESRQGLSGVPSSSTVEDSCDLLGADHSDWWSLPKVIDVAHLLKVFLLTQKPAFGDGIGSRELNYAEIRVVPGGCVHLFRFEDSCSLTESSIRWKVCGDSDREIASPGRKWDIVRSYVSHEEAWEDLKAAFLRKGCILMLEGFLLKKVRDNSDEVQVVLPPIEGDSLSYWHFCSESADLLNVEVPVTVKDLLRALGAADVHKDRSDQVIKTISSAIAQLMSGANAQDVAEKIRNGLSAQDRVVDSVRTLEGDRDLARLRDSLMCCLGFMNDVVLEQALHFPTFLSSRFEPFTKRCDGVLFLKPLVSDRAATAAVRSVDERSLGDTVLSVSDRVDIPQTSVDDSVVGLYSGAGASRGLPFSLRSSFLDPVANKVHWHAEKGLCLGYIYHSNVLRRADDVEPLRKWLLTMLSSPITVPMKKWFLAKLQVQGSFGANFGAESLAEQVACYGLAQACPDEGIRATLLAFLVPNDSFSLNRSAVKDLNTFLTSELCRRVDGKYGVFVCNPGIDKILKGKGFNVQVLDLSSEASRHMSPPDAQYLRILSAFKELRNVVYVKGLSVVSDLFLKWCCEFTAAFPYRYIYFEMLETMFNFAEVRDRCSLTFYDHLPLDERSFAGELIGGMRVVERTYLPAERCHVSPSFREFASKLKPSAEWERSIQDAVLSKTETCVILLISPPGAGKSYLLERVVEQQKAVGLRWARFDCSSDELVERSLVSLLEASVFHQGSPSLLVADEYHLLSDEHKEELLRWVEPRLSWLRVVLIGNRTSAADVDLLNDLKRKVEEDRVRIQLLECRLSIDKFVQVAREKLMCGGRREHFMNVWCRACRGLFGDDALSLRLIEPLAAAFEEGADSLAKLLSSKMPFLGRYLTSRFCDLVYGMVQKVDAVKQHKRTGDPIEALILASLCDEGGNMMTFPEFCSSFSLYSYHPALRLKLWMKLVTSLGSSNNSSSNSSADSSRSVLLGASSWTAAEFSCIDSLSIVDQQGFPLVLNPASGSAGRRNLTLAKSGDFTNLKWLQRQLLYSFTVDWDAAKAQWENVHVTDAKGLASVLTACADPAACLLALSVDNLMALMDSADSLEIARHCMKVLDVSDERHLVASWMLYRSSPDIEIRDVGRMLRWASRFGRSKFVSAHNPEHVRARLVSDLESFTIRELQSALNLEDLSHSLFELWTYDFSSLLSSCDRLPVLTYFLLAQFVHRCPSDWPQFMHALYRIYGGSCTLYDLTAIPSNLCRVPDSRFAQNLLRLDLPVAWQEAILTSGVFLSSPEPAQLLSLLDGLKSIAPRDIRLGGPFVELIRERLLLAVEPVKACCTLWKCVEDWRKDDAAGRSSNNLRDTVSKGDSKSDDTSVSSLSLSAPSGLSERGGDDKAHFPYQWYFADFDGGKGKQEDDTEGDAEKASPILRKPNALLAEVGLLDEWDESE